MTTAQWEFASTIAQGIGSILSVALAWWAAAKVYEYTKRKDRLDFLNQKWSIQQDINLQTLGNRDLAVDFEKIVYGDHQPVDEDVARRHFTLFLMLNLVQSDWFAYRENMITLDEFRQFALAKLNLLARQAEMVRYLVDSRGYPTDFAEEVKALMKRTTPIAPIPVKVGAPVSLGRESTVEATVKA
jgi:hypothetical protein